MTTVDALGWPQMRRSATPACVKAIAFDDVVRALIETRVNVVKAAERLGIPAPPLRRALAIVPSLLDVVIEVEDSRIDLAQQNVDEMLQSDDKLLKKEASFFRAAPAQARC